MLGNEVDNQQQYEQPALTPKPHFFHGSSWVDGLIYHHLFPTMAEAFTHMNRDIPTGRESLILGQAPDHLKKWIGEHPNRD